VPESEELVERPGAAGSESEIRLSRWALAVLGATLVVIVFGAVVRITGSGAGCGQNWPTCHGEIVHLPQRVDTAIELAHRASSFLLLLSVFGLTAASFRCFEPGHRVRRAATSASAMIVVEALLGAGLVLFELVGTDRSVARAVVMPLHLVSTSILLAALVFVAWWSHPKHPEAPLADHGTKRLARIGLALVLLVSATGAVTALGDTVLPVQAGALGERLASDHAAGASFLQQLRIVHPTLAIVAGMLLVGIGRRALDRVRSRGGLAFARAVIALTLAQLAIGAANVFLSAPGYMQVVHLFFASFVWIALVLLETEAGDPRTAPG
jgi:heme A synthase